LKIIDHSAHITHIQAFCFLRRTVNCAKKYQHTQKSQQQQRESVCAALEMLIFNMACSATSQPLAGHPLFFHQTENANIKQQTSPGVYTPAK
jgi:hypothetical protein